MRIKTKAALAASAWAMASAAFGATASFSYTGAAQTWTVPAGVTQIALELRGAQGGGSIVNITTYAAFEPSLWFPASCVYRAGVSAFAKLYADRYGPENIRMNCLLPGFTDSLDVAKYGELAALKRIGKVEEQAKAAAFLLTDDSSYVTGQSLRVDGGVTKHI